MQRGNDRHTGAGAVQQLRHLPSVPQLIEEDHLRRQTAHRLPDPLRLGVSPQHIAAGQTARSGDLSPLIHHRHPQPPGCQLSRQRPQQGGLAAGRLPHQQGAMHRPIRRQQRQQPLGAAGTAAGQTDTQRRHLPHRAYAAVARHRRAGDSHPDAARHRQKALPQLLLMGVHRLLAQAQKYPLQLSRRAKIQPRLAQLRHAAAPQIAVSGGQRQGHRLSAAQTQLLDLRLQRLRQPRQRPQPFPR